jgi:hypothetical protein
MRVAKSGATSDPSAQVGAGSRRSGGDRRRIEDPKDLLDLGEYVREAIAILLSGGGNHRKNGFEWSPVQMPRFSIGVTPCPKMANDIAMTVSVHHYMDRDVAV